MQYSKCVDTPYIYCNINDLGLLFPFSTMLYTKKKLFVKKCNGKLLIFYGMCYNHSKVRASV